MKFGECTFHALRLNSYSAAFFVTHHQDRAVCVPTYRVRNAAHQGSSHPPAPSAAHHHQASSHILGQLDDRPSLWFADLQMLLFDDSPELLEALRLFL
jgi:hypothetical protein